MIPFSTDEVIAAFQSAPNINSALKNLLKKETKPGDPAGRFLKELKERTGRPNAVALVSFINANRPIGDGLLIGIGRYAFSDLANPALNEIIERHADEFNGLYQTTDDSIAVTNEARFKEIVGEVTKHIDAALASDQFAPATKSGKGFMKNVLYASIFDPPVLKHVFANKLVPLAA